jgi:formylmethanofuran dehydrogenase subunit E
MCITDDPVADFLRRDAKEQAWLDKLPRCGYCNEPIQDEHCYEINGEPVCEECLNYNHKKHVGLFMD